MKFRSLKDVGRFLIEQQKVLDISSQIVDNQIRHLKSMALTAQKFEILDISNSSGRSKKHTIDTKFPIVKVPNLKELEKSYLLTEKLTKQYNSVIDAENQVKLSFRNATNENLNKLLSNFTKLKADLEKKMRQLFTELNRIADGHAPKEYKDFLAKLTEELNNSQHIECDSVSTFIYASVKEGKLVFAGYIVLSNAVSDEGETIPNLYICVSWEVGGNVTAFVDHEFVPPNMLSGGAVVENVQNAVKSITRQLSLEGFSSQIGNLPTGMSLKLNKLTNDLFSAAELLNSVEALPEKLVFHFKPKTTAKQLEDARLQLFMEVKALLRRKRSTRMRMKTEGKSVVFTFSGLEEEGVTAQDLDWLADRYKLTHTQLRKIANEINNGNENG